MTTRRPVVQVVGELVADDRPAAAAELARNTVLIWLRDRQSLRLPPKAFTGESFDLDASEGQPLTVARFKDFWAMRLDRLDGEVPGRIWRTEVSIGHNTETGIVGVRLAVIDTSKGDRVPTSVPRVVCDLIDAPGLADYGVRLSARPVDVAEPEVDAFIELLLDRNRTRPVVAVSAGCGAAREEIDDLASRLAGIAHVYYIHDVAADAIKLALGNEFALPARGLRTYYPGFDPELDAIAQHPPATLEWIQRRFGSLRHFVWARVAEFARLTIVGTAGAPEMPSVDRVRASEVEHRLATMARSEEQSERERLLVEQIDLLKKSVAEKDGLYDFAAKSEKEATEERDRYRAQLYAYKDRVKVLEEKLDDVAVDVDVPEDFERLNAWALEHFPGRLQFLSRALRAAKKSTYEDKALVYHCLAKLARDYVDARRAGLPVEGLFESLGVQLERTGSESHLRQWEEEYFFTHRHQSEFLEWHIKKGTGHNEINTLRIYFFYDEEDESVIVGHLTGHLTNAMT